MLYKHVGVYDPTSNPAEIRFKMDRVDYWLSQGVEPSDTVAYLITQVKTGKAVILGAAK